MPHLGLRDAARQVGVHRSSIHRAIRSGKLSATRTETGDYRIDPAELARVFPPGVAHVRQRAQSRERQYEEVIATTETRATGATPSAVHIATLEGEVKALTAEMRTLRELVDSLKAERADLKAERDKWSAQAERLALAGPPRRAWWPFRRAS